MCRFSSASFQPSELASARWNLTPDSESDFLLFVQKVTKAFKGQKLAIDQVQEYSGFIPLKQFVP